MNKEDLQAERDKIAAAYVKLKAQAEADLYRLEGQLQLLDRTISEHIKSATNKPKEK